MSRYTQSVKSIIMENMQPGESISNINDILACAKRCIFDVQNLQGALGDNTDRFELGFVLHYFNDEIGLETPFLWKMGIVEKVYNNNEYINNIYEMLENQILADYNTRVVDGATHDSIVDAGTIANTGTVENAKSGDDTVKNTGTTANAKTGTETGAHTGTDTQVKSGDDTLKRTGQSSDAHTGTNTSRNLGDETLTKAGTETNGHSSTASSVTDGTTVVTGGEKYSESTTDNSTDKSNMGQFHLDTPQDNIMNLRETKTTPAEAYDSTGKGITAASESAMNYMSDATLQDSTSVKNGSSSVSHDATQSRTQTDDDTTVTDTSSGTDTLSFTNRTDTKDVDMTRTDTFNESNTKTDNLQDKTEYNSTTQATKNLTDTTTFNTNDTRTDNLQSKTEYNSENTTTNNLLTSKENETTKDSTNDVTETSRNLNLEMVYRSMPLLNKVWEIFDELFMMLY